MAEEFEVHQLTGDDVRDKGSDGTAARYLALMRRLTKNVPETATADDMVRYIAGSVPNRFWVFGGFLSEEGHPKGILVSVASVHLIPHAWAKVAWVEDVVTFEEHEGHKYSTRVREYAEAFIAKEFPASLGLQRVSRQMLTCSAANQGLYEKSGFVLRDEIVMQKDFLRE